jgi:predicted RecA/RadA family phage recombinase
LKIRNWYSLELYSKEENKKMKNNTVSICISLVAAFLFSMAACQEPSTPGGGSTNKYSVGGTVSGLATGESVVLQINGGETVTVTANGTFTFPTALSDGSSYSVAVLTPPTGKTGTVTNGTGTIAGATIANITVACATSGGGTPSKYSIGGTVSGLAAGESVVLQINGGETVTVTADGTFAFPTTLSDGTAYAVTVSTSPTNKYATVTNGSGTLAGAAITNIAVTCTAPVTVSSSISSTTSWAAPIYVVTGSISINSPLTINPGTTIIFKQNAGFTVSSTGSLKAVGTSVAPITFTGETKTPGFWKGICYYNTPSADNILSYVVIEYGGSTYFSYTDSQKANLAITVSGGTYHCTVAVTNSTFSNSGGYGIVLSSSYTLFSAGLDADIFPHPKTLRESISSCLG